MEGGSEKYTEELTASVLSEDRERIVQTLQLVDKAGGALCGSRGFIYDCGVLAEIIKTVKTNLVSSGIPRTLGLRSAFQNMNNRG